MAVKKTVRTSKPKGSPRAKSKFKVKSSVPKSPSRKNKEGILASAYDIQKAGDSGNPLAIIRMIGGVRVPISGGGAGRVRRTTTSKTGRSKTTFKKKRIQ